MIQASVDDTIVILTSSSCQVLWCSFNRIMVDPRTIMGVDIEAENVHFQTNEAFGWAGFITLANCLHRFKRFD